MKMSSGGGCIDTGTQRINSLTTVGAVSLVIALQREKEGDCRLTERETEQADSD